jgi:DNA-binding NarL/FixJ family response regulator
MSTPITVILADDHPLFRAGLREVIAADPSLRIVGEGGNGEDALALIREFSPMIAILDIDMPKLGGLAVARELQHKNSGIDIIFLTMYKDEDLFNEAMNAGAGAYVLKDSAVNDILAAIHAVAEGKSYISSVLSDHLIKRSTRSRQFLHHNPSIEDLTTAELRVLRLVADNKTSKEIAEILSISYKTVENHRTNISSKLNLHGSHRLLKFAIENKDALIR